ncbi:MAG TPA: hypothetical protein VIN61_05315 [Gammaproteobacteria bacterium]
MDTLVRSRAGGLVRAAVVGVVFVAAATAFAQEGHPLKGSWIGTWKSNETHGESMFMVLDWDGEKITGTINPGIDNIEIDRASLDPDGWVVRLEADAQDKSGRTVHYVIEGKIQDLELPNRSIVGTWRSGDGRGEFEASRQ